MEQRRLRLGDILDDYCPRERRVTNHAVVAMVEEDVKQTRCTTCDAEHVFKGGKAPRRRKTETTGKLYKQVLAGLTDPETAAASADTAVMDEPEHDQAPEPIEAVAEIVDEREPVLSGASPLDTLDDEDQEEPDDEPTVLDEGPVHRPLIRAQLPRIEGLKVERQAPRRQRSFPRRRRQRQQRPALRPRSAPRRQRQWHWWRRRARRRTGLRPGRQSAAAPWRRAA